jgi:pimeloyl-ACP methyl ester carboxylesterase
MSRILTAFLILAVLLAGLPATPTKAETTPTDLEMCMGLLQPQLGGPAGQFVQLDSGETYCIWVPNVGWNGDFVIFAHGYVDPRINNGALPWDQLTFTAPTSDPIVLPAIVVSMGYGFAVTSYTKNGLAVKEGEDDVINLADYIKDKFGANRIYLVGASEGGLVTALAIENNPGRIFTAGVSTCGPVGDFRQQVNYWGDFRVAYDYYFGQTSTALALPVTPIYVDPAVIPLWDTLNPYPDPPTPELKQLAIIQALTTRPDLALKLVASGKAPFDPTNPQTIGETILGILDYNVKATDEARLELSPDYAVDFNSNAYNPYGNKGRWIGTWLDFRLNSWVAANDSFSADPAALAEIQTNYQTSGKLTVPLVTLHTTGDPIVPYWHELTYLLKVWRAGKASNLISIPVLRYGHCAFTAKEAIFAFALAVFRATGTIPAMPTAMTSAGEPVLTQQDFDTMMKQYAPMEPKFYYLPGIQK